MRGLFFWNYPYESFGVPVGTPFEMRGNQLKLIEKVNINFLNMLIKENNALKMNL